MIKIMVLSLLLGTLAAADVVVVKAGQSPKIDGKLDDRAHLAAVAAKSLCAGFFGKSFTVPATYQPLVMLSYDQNNLYVGCWSPTSSGTKAVENTKFSWYNDLIQIVIGPHSFAVNSNGATDPAGLQAAAQAGEGYWVAELVIPWKSAGIAEINSGNELPIRVLAYQTATRDWLHWLPLLQSPQRSGSMKLGTDFPVAYHPRTPAEDDF